MSRMISLFAEQKMETAILFFFYYYDNHEYFCDDAFVRFTSSDIFDSGISNNINESLDQAIRVLLFNGKLLAVYR